MDAVVKSMLQHGVNANAELVGLSAADGGHTDVLRLLIDSGLDLAVWGYVLIW
jgi:hypothetical protein